VFIIKGTGVLATEAGLLNIGGHVESEGESISDEFKNVL